MCNSNCNHNLIFDILDKNNQKDQRYNKYLSPVEKCPEIVDYWDFDKNIIDPNEVILVKREKFYFACEKNKEEHVWQQCLSDFMSAKNKCLFCIGLRICRSNSFAARNPEIAKMWDYERNIISPHEVGEASKEKFWFICNNNSDHKFEASVGNVVRSFKYGANGCYVCAKNKFHKSTSVAKRYPEIVELWNFEENTVSPEEIGVADKRKFHFICNKNIKHKWIGIVSNVVEALKKKNGTNGCSICSSRTINNLNCLETTCPEVAKLWHPTLNGDFLPSQITKGSDKKAWFQCHDFENHKWHEQIYSATKRGGECPICSKSKGEKYIENHLIDNGIPYTDQQYFNTCKNKNRLRFDFAIEINDKNLCIEYQGIQHYEPINFGGKKSKNKTIEQFKDLQMRDKIKEDWCKSNNIPLLLIPYWEFNNINSILTEFIKNNSN